MPLNKTKGNMYEFITHTWNPIKGSCSHDCSYCYMKGMHKRFKMDTTLRLDEKELKTNLGSGNFIFIGSSTDVFAKDVPVEWPNRVIDLCMQYPENEYLFQTKDPENLSHFVFGCDNKEKEFFKKSVTLVTTVETDMYYHDIMKNCTSPDSRLEDLSDIQDKFKSTQITIEPVIDFSDDFINSILYYIIPDQINIGADSGNNNLPEPPKEKVIALISELEKFTKVVQKPNLKRILGE